jgi:hypothetical protein
MAAMLDQRPQKMLVYGVRMTTTVAAPATGGGRGPCVSRSATDSGKEGRIVGAGRGVVGPRLYGRGRA